MSSNSDAGDALNHAVQGGIEGLTVQHGPMYQSTEGTWERRRNGGMEVKPFHLKDGSYGIGPYGVSEVLGKYWV